MIATIEEQGMLKILEHVAYILGAGKQITAPEICEKTGIEMKYFRKLTIHGLIDVSGHTSHPHYRWATIKPNIYMAKEVLKDVSDFTKSTDEHMTNAIELSDHPYFNKSQKLTGSREQRKDQFITKYYDICKNLFSSDVDLRRNAAARELAIRARVEIGYSDKYGIGDIIRRLCKYFHERENNSASLGAFDSPSLSKLKELKDSGYSHRDIADMVGISNATVSRHLNKDSGTIFHFDDFWNLYDKKEDRDKCERKWNLLSESDRKEIMEKLPPYIEATPDKKFRKNPFTYLNNKAWNNEIVKHVYLKAPEYKPREKTMLIEYTDTELWDELKRRGYNGTINKSLQ